MMCFSYWECWHFKGTFWWEALVMGTEKAKQAENNPIDDYKQIKVGFPYDSTMKKDN